MGNKFDDMEMFKENVLLFYNFLLELGIDVFTQKVSFDFLYSMIILFAKIKEDSNYYKAICYYLLHEAKYNKLDIIMRETDEKD
jgi:hypothetical protein